MMSFLDKLLEEPKSQPTLAFVPAIRISPSSTLHLQVEPNDVHTASNIVITAFASKQNRAIVPIRVEWSRYKFKSQSQYIIQKMPTITGNTYMCQPSDLGSIINAKVRSLDTNYPLEGEVSIGPIRLDVMLKRLIDGALYNGSLLSQVAIVEQKQTTNINIRLNQKTIEFIEQNTGEKLIMDYTPSQPKIQLNPKDSTKVYLRFQQDQSNKVRLWLNKIFHIYEKQLMNESSASIRIPHSNVSSVSSNKMKLFPKSHTHCINKMEVRFLSRNSRDLFLFTLRAFFCKQDMKNSVIMEKIQTLQTIKTEQNYHKFLQYISLKSQIIRLSQVAKQFQQDRDCKVQDISDLEDSISEMTKTYLKIIQQKSQNQAVDLQQSYSMISLKREQILGRKNFRQLKNQNQQLKIRIRDLNQQLQLQAFFRKQDNESMMLNQTSNPFAKKSSHIQNSVNYSNMLLLENNNNLNIDSKSNNNNKNMLQMSKSYLKVLQENKRLKSKQYNNLNSHDNDKSQDIQQLLNSLHQNDQEEKHQVQMKQTMERLKIENEKLIKKVQELENNQRLATRLNSSKISRSIANQQLLGVSYRSNTSLDTSMSQSMSMNQSMTSQAEFMILEQKLMDLAKLNTKFQGQNTRLRRQRDHYRSLYDSKSKQFQQMKQNTNYKNSTNNYYQQTKIRLQQSNLLDNSYILKVREENQNLQNEKNNLLKKIDSLIRESNGIKNDSALQKKYNELRRINDKLIQENQRLQKTIQNMKNYHELQKKQVLSSDLKNFSTYKDSQQISKLKKSNAILLQQVKQLRMELQRKNDSRLYNSRVIQLQNQLNFIKGQNVGQVQNTSNNNFNESRQISPATQELLDQIIKQRKQIEKLLQEKKNLQAKIQTQTQLIQKLMSQNQAFHQSNNHLRDDSFYLKNYVNSSKLLERQKQTPQTTPSSKQKSYSQRCTNNTIQEVQKYKKKIKQLQQEIILMRKNNDALNRSRDLSMDMEGYYQERFQVLKKQNQNLILQNQNLSKMCSKYSKDARQAQVQLNKMKQKMMSQLKTKLLLSGSGSQNVNDQSSLLSN